MTRFFLGAGVLLSVLAVALRAQAPPQFAVAVEYVEIEARVLDERDRPIRGLTNDQFQVFEDGVLQDVTAFVPVDMPIPARVANSAGDRPPIVPVRPDVATNIAPAAEGRVFLLLLNDLTIDGTRTPEVRRFLADFVERSLGPNDLMAVSSLWRSTSFQNFTSNRAFLVSGINQLFGTKPPSPTVEQYTSLEARSNMSPIGGPSPPTGGPVAPTDVTYTRAKAIEETLVRIVGWMGELNARSKSIILVSEGIPKEAGSPGPFGEIESLATFDNLDRLAAASRRSSVPIYTLDPRGLTSLADESILVGTVGALSNATAYDGLQGELESSRVGLRRLAADTGGQAFVSTNDFLGALDQVVDRASVYYVLGYYSTNARRDGKFRHVQVKVAQPGAHVAARAGYTAQSDRPSRPVSYPGPSTASAATREALRSKLPMSGLSMTMTAAPFREKGSTASIALVLESPGTELELTERGAPLQVLVSALDDRGAMKATEVRDIQFNLPPTILSRVQQNGFRWLSRVSLKPGRYQLRIAAAGSAKQGSVWYDIEVPDFSGGELSMSGLLVASAAKFATPTLRPDSQLAGVLPGPPTASREFPADDDLTVLAEIYENRLNDARDVDVTVRVRTEAGREVFQLADPATRERVRAARGVLRSITKIPLHVLPGRYVLTVEAERRGDPEHRVSREIPFGVVMPPRSAAAPPSTPGL